MPLWLQNGGADGGASFEVPVSLRCLCQGIMLADGYGDGSCGHHLEQFTGAPGELVASAHEVRA